MSKRRSPSYRTPIGSPPIAVLMSLVTSSIRTLYRAQQRGRADDELRLRALLLDVDVDASRERAQQVRRSLRASSSSTSESRPENSTARFADVPLVSSVTLSMIGWVKLKRVVGNSARKRSPMARRPLAAWYGTRPLVARLGADHHFHAARRKGIGAGCRCGPVCTATNSMSGNSRTISRMRWP